MMATCGRQSDVCVCVRLGLGKCVRCEATNGCFWIAANNSLDVMATDSATGSVGLSQSGMYLSPQPLLEPWAETGSIVCLLLIALDELATISGAGRLPSPQGSGSRLASGSRARSRGRSRWAGQEPYLCGSEVDSAEAIAHGRLGVLRPTSNLLGVERTLCVTGGWQQQQQQDEAQQGSVQPAIRLLGAGWRLISWRGSAAVRRQPSRA